MSDIEPTPGTDGPFVPTDDLGVPVDEAVAVVNIDGTVRWVNDRFTSRFGYTVEAVAGRGVDTLLGQADQQVVGESIARAVGVGSLPTKTPMRLVNAAGAIVEVEIAIRVVVEGPHAPCLVATIREVDLSWRAVFDALAVDEPIEVVLQRCVDSFHDDFYGMTGCVLIETDDGPRAFTAASLPGSVVSDLVRSGDDLPWTQARRERATVVTDQLDFLSDDARAALGVLGLGACVAYVIADPSGRPACCLVGFVPDGALVGQLLWFIEHRAANPITMALLARHRREQLVFAATRDPLTGLRNRAPFFARLRDELASAHDGRNGTPVGMLLIDLDGFKAVNDELGHAVGDDLLVAVAESLGQVIRPSDLLARLGGDEFGVVCSGGPSEQILGEVAARVLHAIHAVSVEAGDGSVRTVGASIGVAIGHGVGDRELMEWADAAMYEAKRRGKDQVVHHADLAT